MYVGNNWSWIGYCTQPTTNQPIQSKPSTQSTNQSTNQQWASRSSERSHLKVDTRFCTTVEKQFLRAEKTPWNVRLVWKDFFGGELTLSLPSPAPNQRIHLLVFLSPSCHLPVTFLSPSCHLPVKVAHRSRDVHLESFQKKHQSR